MSDNLFNAIFNRNYNDCLLIVNNNSSNFDVNTNYKKYSMKPIHYASILGL